MTLTITAGILGLSEEMRDLFEAGRPRGREDLNEIIKAAHRAFS